MKKILLAALAVSLFSAPANALFELRAGYGIQTPAEDNYSGNTLKTITGLNLDALVELPMVPIGLGLRYEDMGFDTEAFGGGNVFESKVNRLSLLVNYRIIDLFAYFGLIGSVGFSNEAEIEITGAGVAKYKADLTTTVGVEGGFSFGLFMVGAELGYAMGTYKDDNNSGNPDLDLGGVYAKALVGVGF